MRTCQWSATGTYNLIIEGRDCTLRPNWSQSRWKMAPTVPSGPQNEADQPSVVGTLRPQLVANQAQQFQGLGFARSIRRAHDIHHQRSQPKPWRRQSSGTHPVINLPSDPTSSTPNINSFVPYTPTIALHANIIPLATSPTTPGTAVPSLTSSHLPVTEIVLIAVGALIAAIVALAGMFMMRSYPLRKGSRVLRCCRRRQKANKGIDASENKGVLVKNDELDDPTWGTPTRFVHVESINEVIEDDDLRDPGPSLNSSPHLMPTWPTHWQRSSPAICDEDDFQYRLHIEENDITLALNVALRGIATDDKRQASIVESPKKPAQETFSFFGHAENDPIFRSLQASIDSLAKGVSSSSITSRARQGSDASASSQETDGRNAADCFSVVTSRSSMTSLTCTESDFDEELEVVYEVKRAHAQSVEIKKGILVACRRSTSASDDNLIPDILPTVVISEPSPILLSLEEQKSHGIMYSLENSLSTMASFRGCNTAPSMSSLARENSHGTLGSLSTSFSATTRTEGWCTDDEGFLQPSIPYLMVTRPSDSSIYTTESSASSVSVDLNDFPLPPKPVKPSYYSRLVDQVHRRKRVWDNHPIDSSVAQRRSTVERFIMMYSSS